MRESGSRTDANGVAAVFSSFDRVVQVGIPMKRPSEEVTKSITFVEFGSEEACRNAESENPIILGGKAVDVFPASVRGKRPMRSPGEREPVCKLYV